MLYGFAASGKTTLAKKYIDEHPLAIAIEGDQLIGMLGQWRKNEDEARGLVFEYTKSICRQHLQTGKDVIIPCLLTTANQPEAFQEIAEEVDATFHEIYIKIEKEESVNRLLERGRWGEEGSRRLTDSDRPLLTSRYEHMDKLMQERTGATLISSELGNIEKTYQQLIEAVNQIEDNKS